MTGNGFPTMTIVRNLRESSIPYINSALESHSGNKHSKCSCDHKENPLWMHAGVGTRFFKGAPAPLRSISYSVRFRTGVGPPEPSCACMVAGGTAPPSLPAHHREFVYVSVLPSSCQEAPQRGTADYSVL